MVNTLLWIAAQAGAHDSWAPATPTLWRVLVTLAIALLLIAWIGRALARGGRYRALSILGEPESARVRAAIAAAEKRTRGEHVVVVLERSDPHLSAHLLAGAAFALLVSIAGAIWLDSVPPLALLGLLAGASLVGYVLAALLPDLARDFTSEAQATGTASEQALVEFHTQNLHETSERTGVLVFASLFERRVIVLGDKGIHEKVGDAHWTKARDLLLDAAAHERLADGIVAAVEECGRVLEVHFPVGAGDVNELPDHLVVRRE